MISDDTIPIEAAIRIAIACFAAGVALPPGSQAPPPLGGPYEAWVRLAFVAWQASLMPDGPPQVTPAWLTALQEVRP